MMKKVTPKNDRLTRIVDMMKNFDLYEKLEKEMEKDKRKAKKAACPHFGDPKTYV